MDIQVDKATKSKTAYRLFLRHIPCSYWSIDRYVPLLHHVLGVAFPTGSIADIREDLDWQDHHFGCGGR